MCGVYVRADGSLARGHHRYYAGSSPRAARWSAVTERLSGRVNRKINALLCVLVAGIAVASQTLPTLGELKELRVREDGLWFSPAISHWQSFGVFAVAVAPVKGVDRYHFGCFGRWVALQRDVEAFARGVASDDAALCVALVVLGFLVHVFEVPSRSFLRRHFAASEANFRAGRVWCLALAAFAHEDALHVSMNGLALGSAAPRLAARLGGDRKLFWAFFLAAAAAGSVASIVLNRVFRNGISETRGASGVVFAMLAFEAARAPDTPSTFYGVGPMPASTALLLALALDAVVRRGGIDFCAHLGGAAFGAAFCEWHRRRCASPLFFLTGRCS